MHKPGKRSLRCLIIETPFLWWVLSGFLISYLFFFLVPIFLNTPVMRFPIYIPAGKTIGEDLNSMLTFSKLWFIAHQTPYLGYMGINAYPPLASVLFTPLLFIKFSWAYKIITLVNVLFYIIITMIFPLRIGKERSVSALPMLVLITGLFSYGFQFELERGQFNIIAMSFCILAIWIYHSHNNYRVLAYALFIISVQLKVYPLIFIVMLIKDWHDWRNNIRRALILLIVNFALFFVLGAGVFFDFIKSITYLIGNPYIWKGNNSIRSFVTWALSITSQHGWTWLNPYSGWIQLTFILMIVVCIFLILLKAFRQNQEGINPYLLVACALGALMIPSASHDYKLSILAAPIVILFTELSSIPKTTIRPSYQIFFIGLIIILSAAYSSTLISYTNKPLIAQNNFPALLIMLLTIVGLAVISPSLVQKRQPEARGLVSPTGIQ
jgi:hypothetical protein